MPAITARARDSEPFCTKTSTCQQVGGDCSQAAAHSCCPKSNVKAYERCKGNCDTTGKTGSNAVRRCRQATDTVKQVAHCPAPAKLWPKDVAHMIHRVQFFMTFKKHRERSQVSTIQKILRMPAFSFFSAARALDSIDHWRSAKGSNDAGQMLGILNLDINNQLKKIGGTIGNF